MLEQVQLRKNIALKINVKKAGENIRVFDDQVKVATVTFGYFNFATPADFVSGEQEFRQQVSAEFRRASQGHVLIFNN